MNTAFGRWYERKFDRLVAYYAVIPLISCFLWNCFVYWTTQLTYAGRQLHDMTTDFDEAVPFLTPWVIVYIGSFIFWTLCYIEISRVNSREDFFRFVFADLFSRTICGVIFLIFPTTNVRPEILGNMPWDYLTAFIYKMDLPYNMFPSIHCLVSLLCFLGLMKSKQLNAGVKIGVFLGALLIFASTQFIKQHYIWDVVGGIVIAILAFYIAHKSNWYKPIERMFNKVNRAVFGKL